MRVRLTSGEGNRTAVYQRGTIHVNHEDSRRKSLLAIGIIGCTAYAVRGERALAAGGGRMEQPNPYPTGTIAFLFTDLERSTRLWQDHPDAMSAAVARHDYLLRNAIESRGGYVFKTVGDAFCVAFETPAAALAAALAAQRALAAEPWDATGSLRARMAVHAG
jgi:class 3 adenylate cyclase